MNVAETLAHMPPPPEEEPRRKLRHDPSLLESIGDPSERRRLALEPTTDEEAWQLACDFAEAKIHGVQSPADAYARMMIGRPLGLTAAASVQGIALVWDEKKQTNLTVMYAKTKLGLLQSRTDKIAYIGPKEGAEQSAKTATWAGKRTDSGAREMEESFTIDDAETAGLVHRGKTDEGKAGNNYTKHPKPMLRWRAVGRLCDVLGADILSGIATREEVEDELRDQEALQRAADEVLSRVPLKTLEQKLADRQGASSEGVEKGAAAKFKARISESVATGDKAAGKALKADFAAWRVSAPPALVEDVLAHWNLAIAKVPTSGKAEKPPTPTATPPAATAGPKPDQTGFGGPRPSAAAEPAAAQGALPHVPTGAYVPPNKRGDVYDGPEDPPPGWRP